MKIKHFAGYGSVTATKLSCKDTNGTRNLIVKVQGNHEYGLVRQSTYDLLKWLVKRFDKKIPDDFRDYMLEYTYQTGYENGVEYCIYDFKYPATA